VPPGQAATTISMSEQTLAKVRYLAAKEDRTVSNWLRRLIELNLLDETAHNSPLSQPKKDTTT